MAAKGVSRVTALATAAALTLSGCATTGSGSGEPMSELDKANVRCGAAVIIGGLIGGAIGNNVGDGNGRRGAVIGAGLGGVYCLVIREAARERDAILAYQRDQAKLGLGGRHEWVGESGKLMVMDVTIDETAGSEMDQITTTAGMTRPPAGAPASTSEAATTADLNRMQAGVAVAAAAPTALAVAGTPRCVYSRSSLTVEGMGAADLGRQRWCEGPDGRMRLA